MGGQGAGPILLVESDRRLGQTIAEQLVADGFSVELACTVEHARDPGEREHPAVGAARLA